jgi:transcriptional regulator with XRE-family HTH domain
MASKTPPEARRFAAQMSDTTKAIGKSLRELREARGWSAEEIVQGMHDLGDRKMNTSQLSRHENGHKRPSAYRLQVYADLYGVSKSSIETGRPDAVAGKRGLMDSLTDAQQPPSLRRVEEALAALDSETNESLDRIHGELKAIRKLLEPSSRKRKQTGK